jgi:3-oxoadipate enol-lactonase
MTDASHSRTGQIKVSDGCALSFSIEEKAGAPRLVLIHPLAMSRAIWADVIGLLRGSYEILTYDCRGHGSSGRAAGPYSIPQFAEDLKAILDGCGWRSATVAGCSMGGTAAQGFAIRHPGYVASLGLIDTTAWYGPNAPKAWAERVTTAREKGLAALVPFQEQRWFSDAFRAQNPDMLRSIVGIFTANDVNCYAATCEMLGAADLRPGLATIRCPTAITVGEEDYATPVEMARALNAAIAGSTLTVIAAARHMTPVERPNDIADFLRGLVAKT